MSFWNDIPLFGPKLLLVLTNLSAHLQDSLTEAQAITQLAAIEAVLDTMVVAEEARETRLEKMLQDVSSIATDIV
jgi:hypothetical protein